MGNRIVTAVRQALGLDRPAVELADKELVNRRLTRYAVRLRAIDARIDADFPTERPGFHRRASDR